MGFKMNGSPAKLGTISGTAGHSSALKMKAEEKASALKQMELSKEETKGAYSHANLEGQDITFNPTGTSFVRGGREGEKGGETVQIRKEGGVHKKLLEERWKKGDKASGGSLNELVAARKKHKKGSAEYAEIQNKINKSLGSKKVHKGTKVTKKGETVETKPKGTTTRKSDDATVVKGLGAQKGKTLTYTDKQAEKERISKEREDIKDTKERPGNFKGPKGAKIEKTQSQKEISEIKSGRDDAKTGTVVSRAWHKARAKRKAKKEARLIAKNA